MTVEESKPPVVIERRFLSLHLVREGMIRDDVLRVLPQEVIIGYELSSEEYEQYTPITVKNPHRSEVISKDGVDYTVDYFLVGIKKIDGQITDDELEPLIYKNNKLIGNGWTYFIKNFKKQ